MTAANTTPARLWISVVVRVICLAALIVAAIQFADWVKDQLAIDIMPNNEALMHKVILLTMLAYVLLTAIPFVPGAELGITLLTLFGALVAPLIYLATLLSLCLAFGVGRLVPPAKTVRILRWLHLRRAADTLEHVAGLPLDARPKAMLELVNNRAVTGVMRHRYVALGLLINMPGNVVLGGGGGLAMIAGLSGVFAPWAFFLTIAVAVLPVPLLVFLTAD